MYRMYIVYSILFYYEGMTVKEEATIQTEKKGQAKITVTLKLLH